MKPPQVPGDGGAPAPSSADAAPPPQQQQQQQGAAAGGAAAAKQSAAAAAKPEDVLAVREDRFLQAALKVRVNDGCFPNCVFLPKTAAECSRDGGPPRLRIDMVEEALIELAQILWASQSLNVFKANAQAFHRLADEAYTKYLPAESRAEAAAAVQQQLVNNTVLLLTCLELFEFAQPPPTAAVSVQLKELLEHGAPVVFINKVLQALQQQSTDESDGVDAAFGPAIDALFASLTARGVADYKAPAVGALRFLSSFKPIENSLLGRLLSFTPLDGPVLERGQQSTVQRVFAGPHALVGTYLQTALQTMRQDIQNVMEIDNQIIRNLCRAGKEERQAVLLWFATVLSSNEPRGQAAHAHLMLQQDTPESADPLHGFMLRVEGQNSFGFCSNLCHALLLLVEPIKPEKIPEISPYYATCGTEGDRLRAAVSGPLSKESLLGGEETAEAARAFYRSIAADDANTKFTTEVFWLTIRSIRLCFNPCLVEFMRWMEFYQRRHEGGLAPASAEAKNIIAQVLGLRVSETPRPWLFLVHRDTDMLHCSLSRLSPPLSAAFVSALLLCCAAVYAQLPPGGPEAPAKPPPQFSLLPSGIIEDVLLSVRHMAELHTAFSGLRGPYGGEVSPCSSIDVELLAAACIAVMGSPQYFRSVHTRCDGACRTLHRLFLLDDFRSRLECLPVARAFLLPALVEVFIDSERGSYYDRINFRIPIVDMLRRLLAVDEYRANIKAVAESSPEKFLHAVHLLLNDISTLVDQAMEALVEIRKRQLDGRDNDQAPVPGQSNSRATGAAGAAGAAAGGSGTAAAAPAAAQEEAESDGDEVAGSLEGRSALERESWDRLQGMARDLCSLGQSACDLFTLLTRHCGGTISSSSSIIPQAVTTLDCCLDHLVGPRCLQLKVNAMENYNFRPKDWLSKVLEAFVYLLQADKTGGDVVTSEILRDGRYYKHANIAKAYRIARREGLMPVSLLEEFHRLERRLAEVEETGKDLIDLDDVPAEYLDPIMADLMVDPVLLPTSNVVMDRRNIERHLMSEPSDPFNRAPLTREQLVPQPDLKREIEAFVAAKKAGSGNKASS